MSGKTGMRHALPGPKVSGPPPYPVGAEADPAFGAKVARCRACGLPGPSDLVGVWRGRQVRFPLCPKCIWEVAGPSPEDADPLHVDEAA